MKYSLIRQAEKNNIYRNAHNAQLNKCSLEFEPRWCGGRDLASGPEINHSLDIKINKNDYFFLIGPCVEI